jgi:hypothetical protein
MIEAPDLKELRALDGRDVVTNALTLLESYQPSELARQAYLDSFRNQVRRVDPLRAQLPDLEALRELLPEIHTRGRSSRSARFAGAAPQRRAPARAAAE